MERSYEQVEEKSVKKESLEGRRIASAQVSRMERGFREGPWGRFRQRALGLHKCNRFGTVLRGKPPKTPNFKSEIENRGGRGEKYSCVWRRVTSETQQAWCEGSWLVCVSRRVSWTVFSIICASLDSKLELAQATFWDQRIRLDFSFPKGI